MLKGISMQFPDKKALKILFNYHPAYPEQTSPEEMEFMRLHGLAFEIVEMTHERITQWVFDEFKKCDKKSIVDNFLVGVGQNQPQLRSALSAYAIMTKFPEHDYQTNTGYECCICALCRNNEVDLTFNNSVRYGCGAVIGSVKPDELAFFLSRHNIESHLQPIHDDILLFSEIMTLIANSSHDEKPVTLAKKIRKIPNIKMNIEQIRHFLGLLGHAGILQTDKHLGFIYKYTNIGLAPSSSRSSDWSYPVDFWRGSDGINADAFLYWFGDYPELRDLVG
jgi:hypothetical protein